MADKRISQLVERINIANNDVLPIVASGATTTNKVTVSTLQDWMQSNLDVGVTSVGLSMPSAFVVSNSPVTASGNISVTGAGTVSQYIRGDGSLADFPSISGGGSSVSYYLNGSVSQGTIGGIAYKEMNRVPVLGAGTDFVAIADGYLASFITDAGDPALLEIPAGNWNFETYFSASSGGGTPTFYVELYKVDSGGTATLIASNSATPELIAFGTTITPYFSTLAVPTTSLAITDRLALRYYVARSGRTITLHTENSHLCQIITTFTTGLTALNGLTAQVQNFATGTSGTDFNISSSVNTHTFNLPDASASARGVVTTGSQTFAGAKTFNSSVTASSLIRTGGTSSQFLKADGSVDSSTYLTTGSAGSTYVPYSGASASVNLGTHSITANVINSAGSGSGAGQINLRSDAFFTLVNGYGSIASGTTNQFNLYQTTGAGVFRGAILSLNGITASATRTYTLPDADGTLALTSQIPTNPVGGTGAQGRVAYWDSTGTITSDSLFQWNDTFKRLGIGRTPTVSLDVEGAGFFSTSVTAQQSNITADGAGVVLQGYVDNNLRIAVRGSGYNSGSRGGLLASSGDFSTTLGVTGNTALGGTHTPIYPLHVQKSVSDNYITHLANTNTTTGTSFGLFMNAGTNGSDRAIQVNNAANTLELFRVFGNGNTDIFGTLGVTGAATFSSSVTSTLSSGIFLNNSSGGTNSTQIRINNTGGDARLGIESSTGGAIQIGTLAYAAVFGNQANAATQFTTNGTARLTILGDGNVGIGTASPGYDGAGYGAVRYTTINNASGTGSNLELATGTTANDGYVGAVDFINTSNTGASGAGRYGIASIRGFTTNASATNTGGGYLTFNTKADGGSGAERMRITSGGNVEATGTIRTGNLASYTAQPFKVGPITNGILTPNAYIRMEINGTPVNVLIAY